MTNSNRKWNPFVHAKMSVVRNVLLGARPWSGALPSSFGRALAKSESDLRSSALETIKENLPPERVQPHSTPARMVLVILANPFLTVWGVT